ncbi:hypothetical protein JTY60_01075 [symbiont of Argiope bruennichi]|uniref:hypothetical protein n=1 Tax=symbiont of Argiope bruennichi TaxID=2810479 RepID=UPI003DA5EDEE
MNKKIIKKTLFPFFSLLSIPLLLACAFHYDNDPNDAAISLEYKKENLTFTFSYYRFFEILTEQTASDFSKFDKISQTPPNESDNTPGFYHTGANIKESFIHYISGISDILARTKNFKRTSSMSVIFYILPKGDESLPWYKGEILANVPLALPQSFINNLDNHKDDDENFKKENWPTFTKNFTLSKNIGNFNFFIHLDQEEYTSLPFIKQGSDDIELFSKYGLNALDNSAGNIYRLDLDRESPGISLPVYSNLSNFTELESGAGEAGGQDAHFTFDNPNGEDELAPIPIIVGAFSLIFAIILYYPTINYIRNKI